MKLVKLLNTSKVAQSVVYDGKQITLQGGEEKLVIEEVAHKFFTFCAGVVQEIRPASVASAPEEQKYIWLANFTGNPEAPATLTVNMFVNKKRQPTAIENPKKAPRTLSYKMQGGHESYIGPSGEEEGRTKMPITFSIPPYQRILLPKKYADWIVKKRDATSEEFCRGAVVYSRGYSAFEPDSSWDIDDMRIYLRLVDPRAEIGESEDTIRKRAAKKKGATDFDTEEALYNAKDLLLRRLHFRCADPQYRLPTKAEFDELKYGRGSPAAPDADELLRAARLATPQFESPEPPRAA